MRLRWLSVVIGVLLIGAVDVMIGQQNSQNQNPQNQGVLILEEAIKAAGGRQALNAAADYRAAGTFSLYSGGEVMDTGQARILSSGLKKFRLTAALSQGTRVWLWKDGNGLISIKGESDGIGRHNLAVLEGLTFPISKILSFVDGPSRTIQLVESTTFEGSPAYRVRISRTAANRRDAVLLGRSSVATDVLISQESFAILAIEDTLYPNSHLRDTFTHRVMYGDYRLAGGVMAPFSVTEEVAGQVTWKLRLETWETNPGVADSQFAVE